MAFDGIVCSAVVSELNNLLLSGKINKIFQPNKNEILLGIYSSGKSYALDVSIDPVNYRLNLSTHSKANPKNVYNFCMVLRKHLTGGTIKKIYMNNLERIVYIEINCYNELNDLITKTLVIELMGKHSNAILLNNDGVIVDSLRHLDKLDNSLRDVLPGYEYVYLPTSKKDFITCTFDSFYKLLSTKECAGISEIISNSFIGFSKSGVNVILDILSISNFKILSLDETKKLYNYIKDLLTSISTKISEVSCFNINNDETKNSKIKPDYYLIKKEQTEFAQINFFIDDFYNQKENSEIFINQKNNMLKLILNHLKRLETKLDNINSKLRDCEKMDIYKLYGELITSNLYKIASYNQKSITLENYYNNNEPIEIKLDSSISPSANAKTFFKKYRKLQNSLSIVGKQKELVTNSIQYLDSIIYDINNAKTLEEIEEISSELSDVVIQDKAKVANNSNKKLNQKESAIVPAEYKIDGYTIFVGKNNKQNDYLTCKIARKNDLWFHTKDIHGSHVVLKNEKTQKGISDSIIYKCATIAAFYSKAKLSQNVPVDYTFIKYVHKPNGAKPGMVTYTDNKTLYVNPKNPAEY